jgi:hypothetical protein
MSRKLILALAAALVAATSLASESADARGFGGFGGGFGRLGGGFGRGFGGGGFGHGFDRVHFGGGHFGGARFIGGYRGHGGGGRLIPILGRGGRGGGHGGLIPIRGPRHPIHPIPIFWPGHHHHWHWVFRGGAWVYADDVVVDTAVVGAVAPVAADPAPVGSCTCLKKTYTPAGLVVFSDMCTKEEASAPVSTSTSDATETPTSPSAAPMSPMQVSDMSKAVDYDGRTYADYLAANPGVAQALATQTASPPPAPDSQPVPTTPATK